MRPIMDLTGQRFGKLVAIEKAENIKNRTAWRCICDCGNEHVAIATNLKRGIVKSCGCYRREFRREDLTGKIFGKLTVLRIESSNNGHGSTWLCECECGNKIIVRMDSLKAGRAKSCGCYNLSGKGNIRHGMSDTRLHNEWKSMKQRCNNPKFKQFKDYGGRGINVCSEWNGKHGFDAFAEWALSHGYREELEIDRIDNNKGYSPDNCRYVTHKENMNNTRVSRRS